MGTIGKNTEKAAATAEDNGVIRYAIYTLRTGNIHGTVRSDNNTAMRECSRANSLIGFEQYGVATLVFDRGGRHELIRTFPEGLHPTANTKLFPGD